MIGRPRLGDFFSNRQDCLTEDAFDRVVNPVDVDPHRHYTEIGIRSHGKGLFSKPAIRIRVAAA